MSAILDLNPARAVAISVCMPVRNGSAFLPQVFACLAAQTFKNFEVILINDGSTDNTAALAAGLLQHYQITGEVITLEQGRGAEQARDEACKRAHAPLIATLDCDDLWAPEYLQEMWQVLETSPEVDLVFCDFLEVFQHLGRVFLKSAATPWIKLEEATREGFVFRFARGSFFSMLLRGQVLFPPCTVFRRAIYERVGGYATRVPDLRISLDWLFGLLVSQVGTIAFLSKPLLHKLVHGANVSADPLRTPMCDVRVLETILAYPLAPADEHHARRRAAIRAREVAYVLWADKLDPVDARLWCRKSWDFYPSRHVIKLALFTFIPRPFINRCRAAIRQVRLALSG